MKIFKRKTNIPLYYSKGFENYLNNMISIANINNDNSEILEDISALNNNEYVKTEISYIDITDNEDTITFITNDQIRKCYNRLNENIPFLEYLKSEKSLSDLGLIKHIKNYQGVWNTARNEMKIGKFIKKVIPRISDSELEKIVNNYKTIFNSRTNRHFEIINGEDIKKWYYIDSYKYNRENIRGLGTLGKSCMRRVDDDYFDIYSKNPEVCSLVLLKETNDNDKIIGRALLWKVIDTIDSSNKFYMDRIYTHFDSDIFTFRNFAKSNGWLTHYDKMKNNSNSLLVQLSNIEFRKYPYMDTFCYLNIDKKIISCSNLRLHGRNYYAQKTDGNIDYLSTIKAEELNLNIR